MWDYLHYAATQCGKGETTTTAGDPPDDDTSNTTTTTVENDSKSTADDDDKDNSNVSIISHLSFALSCVSIVVSGFAVSIIVSQYYCYGGSSISDRKV